MADEKARGDASPLQQEYSFEGSLSIEIYAGGADMEVVRIVLDMAIIAANITLIIVVLRRW